MSFLLLRVAVCVTSNQSGRLRKNAWKSGSLMCCFCRFVVMVPDPNMEQKDTLEADEVLNSLQDFDPLHWGLPPFTE